MLFERAWQREEDTPTPIHSYSKSSMQGGWGSSSHCHAIPPIHAIPCSDAIPCFECHTILVIPSMSCHLFHPIHDIPWPESG